MSDSDPELLASTSKKSSSKFPSPTLVPSMNADVLGFLF